MARKSDIISVSFPKQLSKDLRKVAKTEGRTQSEVLRDAFRIRQWQQQYQALQLYGQKKARELGIEGDEDVMRLLKS